MGISIHMNDSNFYLAAAGKAAAFDACRHLDGHWVHPGDTKGCTCLREVLEVWGYDVKEDADGNFTGIEFNGEKLGDEAKVWSAIAPWVKDGSFIEMGGDYSFRWVFKKGKCKEVRARFDDD